MVGHHHIMYCLPYITWHDVELRINFVFHSMLNARLTWTSFFPCTIIDEPCARVSVPAMAIQLILKSQEM